MPDQYAIANYSVSRDYERLANLSKAHGVICIVDYKVDQREGGKVIRDVARTMYSAKGEEEIWNLSARGTGYVYAFSREEFVSQRSLERGLHRASAEQQLTARAERVWGRPACADRPTTATATPPLSPDAAARRLQTGSRAAESSGP